MTKKSIQTKNLSFFNLKQATPIREYIKRPESKLKDVLEKINLMPKNYKSKNWSFLEALEDIETEIKYDGYIKRHLLEIKKQSANENLKIKKNTNYSNFKGISIEGRLVDLKPLNSNKYAKELFSSNSLDEEGINWAYLPYGPFESQADYAKWIKSFEEGDDPVFFAIISKKLKKAIGIASFLRINPAQGLIEVGHINYSPLLQKTTEATEAMFLMMRWVFDNGYRRYEWKCNALNLKSRRAAQRLGFSYEGVFRQMTISKGRNRDTAWFAIIDKEWQDLKRCFDQFLSESNFDNNGKSKVSLTSLTEPLLYKVDNMDCS